MKTLKSIFGLCFFGLCAGPLASSPYDYCSQILAKGVHDIYDSTHSITDKNLLIAWACSSDSSSASNQATLDLILGNLPERAGYSSNEQWLKENCTSDQRERGSGDYSHNLIQRVNGAVVDAWKNCVGGQNKGLICFAEDSGNSLTFNIGWNPGPGIPRTLDMELSLRNMSSSNTLPLKLIPGEDALDFVFINPEQEAKVVVRATDNISFRASCSYLMIPKQKIEIVPPGTPGDGTTPPPVKIIRGPYPETFVREYDMGNLYIQVHSVTSALANAPQATVKLPEGFKLISGGAHVSWSAPGNLLTTSFPLSASEWSASATDYRFASKGTITAYAIGARMADGSKIPDNVYQLVTQKSLKKQKASILVRLDEGFTLLGGGARVWNAANQKNLSFLTGSFPMENGWAAMAKDHVHTNLAEVNAYAIGLKSIFLSSVAQVQTTIKQVDSQFQLSVPQGNCSVGQNEFLIGGGALLTWQKDGLLLTSSYPDSPTSWSSMGKMHEKSDLGTISTWCLGVKVIPPFQRRGGIS